jgi:acyl carrier protein
MLQSLDQDLFSRIDDAIRAVLNLDDREIVPETTLVGNLGAESIDFLDISCEIEKHFNVEVDFRKLFKKRQAATGSAAPDISVQDLVDYVRELRADTPA